MNSPPQSRAVRPPRQERSRLSWERALTAGRELLKDGGLDALTIDAVCSRAGISPTSLYARVAGRSGLIAAVYDSVLQSVRETEQITLVETLKGRTSREERVRAVVTYAAEIFLAHQDVLRPVIAASATDPYIHAHGVADAQRVQRTMAEALDLPIQVSRDIAAMVFVELVVHTVYGREFSSVEDVDDAAFRARLVRVGLALAESGMGSHAD